MMLIRIKILFRFDGVNFKVEPSSQFNHTEALGSYRRSPFVTGSKTEILNYENGQWNQAADYPHELVGFQASGYATTHTAESVFIIGGHTDKIVQYKDDIWTIAGRLKKPRFDHGAIIVKGITMILGGWVRKYETAWDAYHTEIELWHFESTKTKVIGELRSYSGISPLLFPVEAGFCHKK